jgi:hypothetical protein
VKLVLGLEVAELDVFNVLDVFRAEVSLASPLLHSSDVLPPPSPGRQRVQRTLGGRSFHGSYSRRGGKTGATANSDLANSDDGGGESQLRGMELQNPGRSGLPDEPSPSSYSCRAARLGVRWLPLSMTASG